MPAWILKPASPFSVMCLVYSGLWMVLLHLHKKLEAAELVKATLSLAVLVAWRNTVLL